MRCHFATVLARGLAAVRALHTQTATFTCSIAAMVLLSAPLRADIQIDFGVIAPTSGTISYAGGAAPLIGLGISVDNVTGLNTPLHNLVSLPCSVCFLNFTTGAASSTDATHWFFGGGGFLTITGSVNGSANTTLLSGTFDEASVNAMSGGLRIAGGTFINTVSPLLSSYFGTGPGGYTGGFDLSFLSNGLPPGAFTSAEVGSGDVVTSPASTPVPEPSSGLMVLTVFGAGAAIYRRRCRVRPIS